MNMIKMIMRSDIILRCPLKYFLINQPLQERQQQVYIRRCVIASGCTAAMVSPCVCGGGGGTRKDPQDEQFTHSHINFNYTSILQSTFIYLLLNFVQAAKPTSSSITHHRSSLSAALPTNLQGHKGPRGLATCAPSTWFAPLSKQGSWSPRDEQEGLTRARA